MVLDAFNRPVARDNLTTHDLGNPQNYAALQRALLTVATPADTDQDRLPDDWERAWFGKLDPAPDGDADGDGASNFEEFAFASSPIDPASKPRLFPVLVAPSGQPSLATVFRRFSGGAVDFVAETSPDLVTWSASTNEIVRVIQARNLYDGAGGAEARFQLTPAAGAKTAGFVRIRPVPTMGN